MLTLAVVISQRLGLSDTAKGLPQDTESSKAFQIGCSLLKFELWHRTINIPGILSDNLGKLILCVNPGCMVGGSRVRLGDSLLTMLARQSEGSPLHARMPELRWGFDGVSMESRWNLDRDEKGSDVVGLHEQTADRKLQSGGDRIAVERRIAAVVNIISVDTDFRVKQARTEGPVCNLLFDLLSLKRSLHKRNLLSNDSVDLHPG